MRLKRITTKEGDVYFVNAKTGERIKTSNGGINSKVLLIITTIYGVLYTALIIGYLISEYPNSKITLEGIIVGLAFIVFLVGYYYSWKNEMIAGIVFIFWWGIMWYLGLFIAETEEEFGIIVGLPMFIIGILFIVHYIELGKRIIKN